MTTTNKIEELQAAFEAATPGEWSMDDGIIYGINKDGDSHPVCDVACDPVNAVNEQDEHNATFIILARQMMPALLCAVEALKASREYLSSEGSYATFKIVAEAIDKLEGVTPEALTAVVYHGDNTSGSDIEDKGRGSQEMRP